MNERLVGAIVVMMIMAYDCGVVNTVVTQGGSSDILDGSEDGYLVSTACEDDSIGISVTVVEGGEMYKAELRTNGEVTMIQGDAEGFISACDEQTQAW